MVIWALSVGAMVPRSQVRVSLANVQSGAPGVERQRSASPGSVSVTVTEVAGSGPLLVTVMV